MLPKIDWRVLLGNVFRFASREGRKHRQLEERVIENICQPPQKRNRRLSWNCRPGSATLASPKNVDVIVPT